MGAARGRVAALLVAALLLGAFAPPASAASYPAKVVSGFLSNAASAVLKRLWSLKSTAKTASGAKSMVKYEGGYTVETVFDGSKLGIEPYAVEVTQGGELLVMDSMNSNIYRIALPLSRYSRPKLVAGSPEGIPGHIDGRLREAKMNHPKGFTVDGRGNIYVADAMNMAVRKISDTGVTTIAGGKSSRGGHVDGPSDDAKFSTDFEVRYIASSCSLLVIDRGNQAIREIQLNFDDCVYQYEAGFPLGVALLLAAGFFGYMLALLQRRVLGMVSTEDELQTPMKASIASIPPYQIQKPLKPSLRPPLIPNEDESEKLEVEEGFFTSLGKLIGGAKSSVAEIVGAAFSRKKRPSVHHYQQGRSGSWPVQESYAIPRDETPPVVDTRTPTPRKNYAFMSKEPEKIHHIRQGRAPYNGWNNGESPQQQQQQQQQQPEPNFPNISTQSWYPPSVGGSSSLPSTPSSSGASPHQRASDHPQPSSRGQPSPAEAAGIIARLRDKSVDELQRLLKDKESYNAFFNSLDQVKTQNNLRDELRKEILQLARENLEKEQRILELRNQCTIIRTTELAAAEDRLAELERQKDEIMKSYSPAALLDKLQSTMAKLDEESEELHQKFLEKDVDLPTFVQKYKKLRAAHHKCALLHLSGKASLR